MSSSNDAVCKLPQVSKASVGAHLKNLYGIEGELGELNGERDRNFLVTTCHSGEVKRYVFKVANLLEDPAMLKCQEQVLNRLSRDRKLETIEIVPSVTGQSVVQILGDDSVQYNCRLTTFLEGALFSEIHPRSTQLLESLGRVVARVDMCLQGFEHDSLDRPLLWTMQNVEQILARFKPLVNSSSKEQLIDYFQTQFQQHVLPVADQLRRSVIHNDANDNNIVVKVGGPWDQAVVGLIDFGDMVESWLVVDPAVACAYAMLGQPHPLDVAASIIKGYHQTNPLRDAEIQTLYS
ncbi:MAG: phosphotransferase, partial [bacterium]